MRLILVSVAMMLAGGMLAASPVMAAETSWWRLSTSVKPTVLDPGSDATIVVRAVNLGNAAVSAVNVPVTITDTLPAGVTVIGEPRGVAGFDNLSEHEPGDRGPMTCTTAATVTCTWAGPEPLEPYETLEIYVKVAVGSPPAGAANAATISGGEAYRCLASEYGKYSGPFCRETEAREEAPGGYESSYAGTPVPSVSNTQPVTLANIAGEATPFGMADFEVAPENEGGAPDTREGSHPFQLTTAVAFNESSQPATPPAFAKNLKINLPPGLVGNAQGIPQCTEADFSETFSEGGNSNLCPNDSAVGVASVSVAVHISGFGLVPLTLAVPVFNLLPARGEPARFGFEVEKAPVVIDTSVHTGTSYGIVASVSDISQFAVFLASDVTLWGTPGAAAHRISRGWSCIDGGFFREREELLPACTATGEAKPQPFLRMPTSCTGPLASSAETDSWQEPTTALLHTYTPGDFGHQSTALSGCEGLPFAPQLTLKTNPEPATASTPTGLSVDVRVPQEASQNANGIAESDLKTTTVTLPAGVTLNPAGANGLQACSESQIGFETGSGVNGFEELNPITEPGSKTALFTPTLGSPFCPNASKIGEVTIHTPLLANPLQGSVYLAAQTENPFGSLVAMYIVAEDPVSGVLVKLPGEVSLNPSTGQITTTFQNTPQLPFEELELKLFGGNGAPLSTPTRCGTYTTNASFTSWSGGPSVRSSSSFQIGGACPATLPFNPSFTAGTTATQAGAYSPFTLTFARQDGEQDLNSIEQTLPPGLLAKLAGVPLCGEAQANEGSCPAASQIGTVTVAAGVGKEPLYVNGTIYLTGPYNNGPFGITVEVPAIAGPFNLDENGRPVVVRGSIRINPTTAQATVVSNAFPTILQGIPLQIRSVNVTLNRAGFTFNPTNCAAQGVTATISSTEGATAGVSSPFGTVNCATLPFKPSFTATTVGQASKAYGASLTVKIASKGGPGTTGEEANIRSFKVDLPKQLPSRLSTLQKACTEAQFNSNPAGCPKESNVGTATAKTPVLASPLTGPAYLVSHGGEAFPDLEIVLQSEGVKLVLDGNTLIKKGITSSTFKTVPDAPISSFELKLPVGKYSILGTNLPQGTHYNLCGQTLNMPTAITGQNGAEIHESTPIEVAGCSTSIAISSHQVKKQTLTLAVYVPAAGKLKASGRGVSAKTKTVKGRETVTLTLTQSKAGKLRTRVLLSYTPSTGKARKKQARALAVRFVE
jgi:hypothetical protein